MPGDSTFRNVTFTARNILRIDEFDSVVGSSGTGSQGSTTRVTRGEEPIRIDASKKTRHLTKSQREAGMKQTQDKICTEALDLSDIYE